LFVSKKRLLITRLTVNTKPCYPLPLVACKTGYLLVASFLCPVTLLIGNIVIRS